MAETVKPLEPGSKYYPVSNRNEPYRELGGNYFDEQYMESTTDLSEGLMQIAFILAVSFIFVAPTPLHAALKILVVTAVDYEYSAVTALLEQRHEAMLGGRQFSTGQVGEAEVAIIRSGWGKAHASGATALAIQHFSPQFVIMAGIAGGIDATQIKSGDIVISQGTFQHDLGKLTEGNVEIWRPETPLEQPFPHDNFVSPDQLIQLAVTAAQGASFTEWKLPLGCICEKDGRRTPECVGIEQLIGRAQPKICAGVMATGDTFVVDPIFAAKLANERKAVSVDMETAAVAQEAANHGLPFIGVRVIGDVVDASTSESLYYCLKPLSGPRLGEVMAKVLLVLSTWTNMTKQADFAQIIECVLNKPVPSIPARLLHLR